MSPECYVTARKLAAMMGVSERTVWRMVATGMPSQTWGLRTRRFLPAECLAWAQNRGSLSGSPDGAPTPARGISTIEVS